MKKLLLAALALVLLGGVASAAIPDGSGVIHACYQTTVPEHGTNLLVIDEGGSCGGGKTEVTWNQEGPAGPTGAVGPQGATGPAGPTGESAPVPTYTVRSVQGNPLGSQVSMTAECASGEVAISGGYDGFGGQGHTSSEKFLVDEAGIPRSYQVSGFTDSIAHAYVLCVS